MLYTHSSGNNLGNIHFIWHVPNDQPENEVLARSRSVILQVQKQIAHFHTRATRTRFIQAFGLVTGAKPAFLQEMYHQLTGDGSSAHDKGEDQIDQHVRSPIDMEDLDIIIDVCALNQGHSSRYDVFWETCHTYIENTAGVAVDDRRHDHVTHLAAAMSVSDLRKQVRMHECRHDTQATMHAHRHKHPRTHTEHASQHLFMHTLISHTLAHSLIYYILFFICIHAGYQSAQKGLPIQVNSGSSCNFGQKSP